MNRVAEAAVMRTWDLEHDTRMRWRPDDPPDYAAELEELETCPRVNLAGADLSLPLLRMRWLRRRIAQAETVRPIYVGHDARVSA